MGSFTKQGRGRSFLTIVGALAIGMVAGQSLMGERSTPKVKKHHVVYPDVDLTVANGCAAELAAYVAALDTLSAAEQAADDAYQEWLDCEMGGTRPVNQGSVHISADHSVLVR